MILDAFNSHIDLTISQGLGITIAGYTCEREELSGIFVKSVNEGSAAHRSGKVAVNDQIIEVDGRSIQGYTNQQGCHSVIAVMIGNIIRIISSYFGKV